MIKIKNINFFEKKISPFIELPSKEYEKYREPIKEKMFDSFYGFFGNNKMEALQNNFFILNKRPLFQNLQAKYEELLKLIVIISINL